MQIIPIITGATGMVGEGVLLECLENENVEKIYVVGRRSCGIMHPKLTEIIHQDLSDISSIADQFSDANACFFCAGISSVGVSDEEYKKLTYDLTIGFANGLAAVTKDVVFCYVSGQGTDETETSRLSWARVKGKTENDLAKIGFKDTYAVRFGLVWPTKGQKNILTPYKFLGWLKPLFSRLMPGGTNTLEEVARAMINVVRFGYDKKILTQKDISNLAKN